MGKALPLFHAFTGCDTIQASVEKARILHGIDGWHFLPLHTFVSLANQPGTISELEFEELQQLTVIMYQRTCELSTCDEAKRFSFTSRRGVENIPPTSDALFL